MGWGVPGCAGSSRVVHGRVELYRSGVALDCAEWSRVVRGGRRGFAGVHGLCRLAGL